jgi:hypothetical protein
VINPDKAGIKYDNRMYFQSPQFQFRDEILRPFIFKVIIVAIAGHHIMAPTYIREGYKFTMA